MNEAANILNNATSKSLIILDEIGRGTATFDGLSLAWSITEYLHNNKKLNARTMFATHYHELIYLANKLKKAFNLNIEVKEHNDELIFLRKIKEGGANKSYGIQVAEMAGLPSEIINRSKELLLKFSSDKMKDESNLDNDKKQLDLFKYENKLIKKLKSIDLNKISPIESLIFLNELINEINDN
jgi:DNA mismatch repair protein MutS